ncbi:hypothetical protein BaRGS_00010342 [Batillaria attramentaria]|uniref:AP-5 complex subunit sigma-1 n=1 Tax=Batillaria attramentaria TaxID=370345 RepID=A0ABD0LGM3_9CAEN
MVLAFIITTLNGDSPLVLYYQIYGQVVSSKDGSSTDASAECVRRARKRHVARIAETVHSEYQFRREVNNLTPDEDIQRLSNDDTLPDFEVGHFLTSVPVIDESLNLDVARNDQESQHVTWMGAGLTGFILLCDACENRVLAGQVLRLLVRFLQEHVRVLSQPSEVATRVDRVAEVLERVLPDGNLLFMNHRVVRHIEKELDTAMKTAP